MANQTDLCTQNTQTSRPKAEQQLNLTADFAACFFYFLLVLRDENNYYKISYEFRMSVVAEQVGKTPYVPDSTLP